MSQQPSATMIGGFTLVGLIVAVVGVVAFGAGQWLEPTHEVALFFERSAQGLQEGSDVRFGGVLVGRVKSIQVVVDRDENKKIIPVVVELGDRELRAITEASGADIDLGTREGVDSAVEAGLRARMVQQSLLTGMLYVEFDMVPDSDGFVFDGAELLGGLPTVPTVDAEFDELISGIADGLEKFNEIDLQSILSDLETTLTVVRDQVEALEVGVISENLVGITNEMKTFFEGHRLSELMEEFEETLAEVRSLASSAREGIDPVMADLASAIESAGTGLQQFERAAAGMAEIANPRAPVLIRVQNVLRETERAARVISELAEDIRRNPNSLLFGRDQDD